MIVVSRGLRFSRNDRTLRSKTSLREKMLVKASKDILEKWCHNLMGEFSDFYGETSIHIEKTETASKYSK